MGPPPRAQNQTTSAPAGTAKTHAWLEGFPQIPILRTRPARWNRAPGIAQDTKPYSTHCRGRGVQCEEEPGARTQGISPAGALGSRVDLSGGAWRGALPGRFGGGLTAGAGQAHVKRNVQARYSR